MGITDVGTVTGFRIKMWGTEPSLPARAGIRFFSVELFSHTSFICVHLTSTSYPHFSVSHFH